MLSVEIQKRTCRKCSLKLNGCATWNDRKEKAENTVLGWDMNRMALGCMEYKDKKGDHGH